MKNTKKSPILKAINFCSPHIASLKEPPHKDNLKYLLIEIEDTSVNFVGVNNHSLAHCKLNTAKISVYKEADIFIFGVLMRIKKEKNVDQFLIHVSQVKFLCDLIISDMNTEDALYNLLLQMYESNKNITIFNYKDILPRAGTHAVSFLAIRPDLLKKTAMSFEAIEKGIQFIFNTPDADCQKVPFYAKINDDNCDFFDHETFILLMPLVKS
jgi:hypothetical protein